MFVARAGGGGKSVARSRRPLHLVGRRQAVAAHPSRQMATHQRSVLALQLDPAVVQFDEAVDEREPEPRARTLARAAPRGEAVEDVGLTSGATPGPLSETK